MRDEVLADRRVADGQFEPRTAKAMRIEHELAVPVLRHFHPIAGSAMHAPEARRRRAGQGIERQLRLVDEILGWLLGFDDRRTRTRNRERYQADAADDARRSDKSADHATKRNSAHAALAFLRGLRRGAGRC